MPHFKKGSPQAKAFMAKLRAMVGKKRAKKNPCAHPESSVTVDPKNSSYRRCSVCGEKVPWLRGAKARKGRPRCSSCGLQTDVLRDGTCRYCGRKANPLTRREAGRQIKWAKRDIENAEHGRGTHAEIYLRGQAHGRARVVVTHGPREAEAAARKIQKRSEEFRGKNPPLLILGNPGRRRKFKRPAATRHSSAGECPKGFPASIWRDPQFQRELKVFRSRHGANVPITITPVKMPAGSPRFMTAYGHAQHAVYDAPKQSRRGKFIHHFGKKGKNRPFLVSSAAKGPRWLGYAGGTFKARKKWLYD